jgi:uncharacterized protein (TIGR02145 family)
MKNFRLFLVLFLLSLQACDWAKEDALSLNKLPKVSKGAYFVDPRDQSLYATVHVENMTWLGSNMRYAVAGSGCVEDCDRYGRMYTYEQALQACPPGWKLPAMEDWKELSNALNPPRMQEFDNDFYLFYAYVLNQAFDLRWPGFINSSDERGFKDTRTYFWTSTKDGANQGIFYLENNSAGLHAFYIYGSVNNRISCLCVKDE